MWNLWGQGVTAGTPSQPRVPQGLSHQPPRALCIAGTEIHPQAGSLHTLSLSSESHFPLDFPSYPNFFKMNSASFFPCWKADLTGLALPSLSHFQEGHLKR